MQWAPLVLGSLGAVCAVRALWRPHRAVVREGRLVRCPETTAGGCDPTVLLTTARGGDVLAVLSGTVASVGPTWIHLVSAREPVVAYYEGVSPEVGIGDEVGRGEAIGTAPTGEVAFGVQKIVKAPPPEGRLLVNVDPASWLASRGLKLAGSFEDSTAWCAQGRTIAVPKSIAACDMYLPDPAGFSLLPVTTTIEK